MVVAVTPGTPATPLEPPMPVTVPETTVEAINALTVQVTRLVDHLLAQGSPAGVPAAAVETHAAGDPCPEQCGGKVTLRKGRSPQGTAFWGCTNWRPNHAGCDWTAKIAE